MVYSKKPQATNRHTNKLSLAARGGKNFVVVCPLSISPFSISLSLYQESIHLLVVCSVYSFHQSPAVEASAGHSWDNKRHDSSSPLAKVHLLTCWVYSSSGEMSKAVDVDTNVLRHYYAMHTQHEKRQWKNALRGIWTWDLRLKKPRSYRPARHLQVAVYCVSCRRKVGLKKVLIPASRPRIIITDLVL